MRRIYTAVFRRELSAWSSPGGKLSAIARRSDGGEAAGSGHQRRDRAAPTVGLFAPRSRGSRTVIGAAPRSILGRQPVAEILAIARSSARRALRERGLAIWRGKQAVERPAASRCRLSFTPNARPSTVGTNVEAKSPPLTGSRLKRSRAATLSRSSPRSRRRPPETRCRRAPPRPGAG